MFSHPHSALANPSFNMVPFWGVFVSLFVCRVFAAEPEVCVIRADGTEVCGAFQSWTAEGLTVLATTPQTIAVDDLDELRFPRAKRRSHTSDWVVLGTGDRFPLTVQRLADDVLTAGWSKSSRRPELAFPLENVAAIVRQMPAAASIQRDWLGALQQLPTGKDSVRLVVGEDLTGEFSAWENGLVQWRGSLGAIQLDLQRVRWIRFDPDLTTIPEPPALWWAVHLVDGTRFTATACQPRPDQSVEWTLPVGGVLTVPRHEIVKATRWSPRRRPLSQRELEKTEFTPYLSGKRAIISDRSVHQAPLALRGEEFSRGLGMQSRTIVEYRLQPGDSVFRATVGIDDVAEGKGSARFSVRVDDREVWESGELTGRSPAVRLPSIALDAARTLTLTVDFGEYGDVGDFADWCDASIWQSPLRN